MQYQTLPILLMLAVIAAEMATDIYLPSLPIIAKEFLIDEEVVQRTISSNLLGLGISSLFYGPLADFYGRRSVMITGIGLFFIASFICIFVENINFLITARFIQGFGAGVAAVISNTMIRDIYKSKESVRLHSLIQMAIALSPAVAPMLGGWIAEIFQWRANFIIITVMLLIVFILTIFYLPETLPKEKRLNLKFSSIFKTYYGVIQIPHFFAYSLISALTLSSLWSCISILPFIFFNMGISASGYGFYTLLWIIGYVVGLILNRKFVMVIKIEKLIFYGLCITFISGLYMLLIWYLNIYNPLLFALGMGLFSCGCGLVFSNSTIRAMEVPSPMRGSASALLACIEMVVSASAISLVGDDQNTTIYLPSVFIIITSIVTMIILFLAPYKKKAVTL